MLASRCVATAGRCARRASGGKSKSEKKEPDEDDLRRLIAPASEWKEEELEFFPHYAASAEESGRTAQTPVEEAVAGPGTLVRVRPIDDSGRILGVEINRPPGNLLSMELLRQLKNELRRANQDAKYQGLVLTSQVGPGRDFCGGVDVAELLLISRGNQKQVLKYWSLLQDVWRQLYASKMVTVAALSGRALGAGCALAAACDYRFVFDSPKIPAAVGYDETSYGLTPGAWAIECLADIVGPMRSRRMATYAELLTAHEAQQCGLVDRVVAEPGALFAEALACVQSRLAATSAEQRRHTKAVSREDALSQFDAHREEELDWLAANFTADHIKKAAELHAARRS